MPLDLPPTAVAPVVVQAARLPPAASDPAFSIVTVDPAALQALDRVDDALETVPGFSLYRRTSSLGANPTTQGVSLRGIAGSGASRALVTLDGVPQNDPFGGWVIWTALPPETVSSATVVRGAGAGAYGAGALTGVVALEQPTSVPGGAGGEIEYGQLGYGRAAAITETKLGTSRLFLDASGETSDGYIPVRAGRGAADRPLTLHDWSAGERLESDVGRAVLSQRLNVYEEDRGAGTLDAGSRDRGVQASLTLAAQPTPDRLGWRLQGWVEGSDLKNTSASVPLDRATATLADNQYATPTLGVGLNAAVRRTAAASSLEIGADVRDFDGESREHLYSQGVFSGNRTSGGGETVAGVYAEASRTLDSRALGRWLVTGGARLDGWLDYGSELLQSGSTVIDQHPGDRGGAVPTGRLGLRHELTHALYIRAAAYTGFRPATLNELHRPFRVGNNVTLANAALSPEHLYGAEVGMGGHGWVVWDGDVFFNQLADAVTNVTIGHGPGSYPLAGYIPAGGILYQRENAGRVNAAGVEGEASRRFAGGLELRAAFTYTHARVDGGAQAPQLTGRRPAQTPSTTATLTASWRPLDRLNLFADVRYESERFDDDLNTLKIDSGGQFDARAEWRITGAVNAFVAADNLTDAGLETGRSAAGVVTYDAPRLVRIGLTLRR